MKAGVEHLKLAAPKPFHAQAWVIMGTSGLGQRRRTQRLPSAADTNSTTASTAGAALTIQGAASTGVAAGGAITITGGVGTTCPKY